MLTVQQISDRLEIEQLLVDYAHAIDLARFDDLDGIFTPDAYIDYRAMGGIDGRFPEIKLWLKSALERFPHRQHLVTNISIKLDGDGASVRSACINPMGLASGGAERVLFFGLWYVDKVVRTPAGWRISERVEERCYAHNLPAGFGGPAQGAGSGTRQPSST